MLLGLVRMVYEMDNNLTSTDIAQDDNSREKIKSLFKYIQELNKLKRKTVLNVKDYAWCLWIKNLPDDAENIKLFYQDRLEDDEINGEDNFLLWTTTHEGYIWIIFCLSISQNLRHVQHRIKFYMNGWKRGGMIFIRI